MMIRTTAKSVYYPISGQRAAVIRESARVRYVRGSLLVNAKYFLTAKRLNDRGWQGFAELQSEDERGRFA
jgi:hypothetical protein